MVLPIRDNGTRSCSKKILPETELGVDDDILI